MIEQVAALLSHCLSSQGGASPGRHVASLLGEFKRLATVARLLGRGGGLGPSNKVLAMGSRLVRPPLRMAPSV